MTFKKYRKIAQQEGVGWAKQRVQDEKSDWGRFDAVWAEIHMRDILRQRGEDVNDDKTRWTRDEAKEQLIRRLASEMASSARDHFQELTGAKSSEVFAPEEAVVRLGLKRSFDRPAAP